MRTKLILTTAAFGVASFGALAQVYSVNAVGYINVPVPGGGKYALVGNQLNTGAANGNKIGEVLPGVPDGTTVFTYGQAGGFDPANSFVFGEWTNPNATLQPGKGFFIQNNTAADITVTLVGEVPQGALTTALNAGLNLVASQVPQAGGLGTVLGFPAGEGDTVFQWNASTQAYNPAKAFVFGAWDPSEPAIAVAEGFFVEKGAAASWTRNFSVN
jgi:hypothetical protein